MNRQSNNDKNSRGRSSKRYSAKPSGKRIGKSRPQTEDSGKTNKTRGKSVSGEKKYTRTSESNSSEGRVKKYSYSKQNKRGYSKKTEKLTDSSKGIRLNRFIANAGVCSRREADTYIEAGVVTINGKPATQLGIRVMPNDEVRFDGRLLSAEKKVYLLLNKPKDFVTTTDDPHAEKIVLDLVKNACDERIYPVGRLDRNTTGLLLFTNDGDLSKKLTHPSHNMKKIYQVSLDKPLTKTHLETIAEGIELEDGFIAADAVSYINTEEKTEVGIEIHSGKNRIVRRIFEHFGYKVKKLDRVMFAGLTKKNLSRGKWRFLSEKEVKFLKMM